jgi:hypothetical protein
VSRPKNTEGRAVWDVSQAEGIHGWVSIESSNPGFRSNSPDRPAAEHGTAVASASVSAASQRIAKVRNVRDMLSSFRRTGRDHEGDAFQHPEYQKPGA